MKYLFATANKAKIRRYGKRLIENGIEIVTLNDLNIDSIDIDENGKNSTENAIIKATAYYKESNIPTIAMDDGLFLYNVPEKIQPGTHVRRVNGKRLNDKEMIEHYNNDSRIDTLNIKRQCIREARAVGLEEYSQMVDKKLKSLTQKEKDRTER